MQQELAEKFCHMHRADVMDENSDDINENWLLTDDDEWDRLYEYNVYWMGPCNKTSQTLEGCYELMRGNFQNCNNGGKGGSRMLGCLEFEYRANLLHDADTA